MPDPVTDETPDKPKRPQQVFTLLVEVGRHPGDGLPEGSTGAALLCYASGVTEAEAVNETVVVLKQADLAPLDITSYGTAEERAAAGDEVPPEERTLMDRARAENAVIVAQMTPFFEDGDGRAEATAPASKPKPKSGPQSGPQSGPKPAAKPGPKPGPKPAPKKGAPRGSAKGTPRR
jgi:hypothetical protein